MSVTLSVSGGDNTDEQSLDVKRQQVFVDKEEVKERLVKMSMAAVMIAAVSNIVGVELGCLCRHQKSGS
jgi:hypothetical protein